MGGADEAGEGLGGAGGFDGEGEVREGLLLARLAAADAAGDGVHEAAPVERADAVRRPRPHARPLQRLQHQPRQLPHVVLVERCRDDRPLHHRGAPVVVS